MSTASAFLGSALLVIALAVPRASAAAAAEEVGAALQVMGYGYKVKVLVNGVDTGVQGGKSEGRRLFSKGHSMEAKAAPELRARHFILQRGANDIAIEYSKIDPKTDDRLEITLDAEGYPQPLLTLVNRTRPADKISVKIALEPKAPPSFKPVVIGDAK